MTTMSIKQHVGCRIATIPVYLYLCTAWSCQGLAVYPTNTCRNFETSCQRQGQQQHPSSMNILRGNRRIQPLYSQTTAPTDSVETENDTSAPRGALSMGLEELAESLGGMGRARLAWDCYSLGVDPQLFFSESSLFDSQDESESQQHANIQKLIPSSRRTQTLGKDALNRLAGLYPNHGGLVDGGVAALVHTAVSADGTTKLLLKLMDGQHVETVIIPWNGVRSTLCISSQVGCRQACRFCATGKMGKLRSLTADEILAQVFFARQQCRLHPSSLPPVTNVVFMGMGEPADNVDAVVTATNILTTRELFQMSATKVTVSTVAPTPEAFEKLGQAPCVLAWSVHAARDDLRRQLVPTTTYPMVQLRQALIHALCERPEQFRTTMLEVALIRNINDSVREADELAEFARGVVEQVPGCKLIVNVIPFNDIGHAEYQKPTKEDILAFQKRLWNQGICAHVRATRGDDESAACGQLATKKGANELGPSPWAKRVN